MIPVRNRAAIKVKRRSAIWTQLSELIERVLRISDAVLEDKEFTYTSLIIGSVNRTRIAERYAPHVPIVCWDLSGIRIKPPKKVVCIFPNLVFCQWLFFWHLAGFFSVRWLSSVGVFALWYT